MSAEQRQIDTTIEIVTPENISFHYQLAGPFRRLPAFFIDLGIKGGTLVGLMLLGWILVFSISYLLGFNGSLGNYFFMSFEAFVLILFFGIQWFYGGFFETYWNGQTPGKWLMSIRVLTTNGKPINGLQAVMRNVLREIDTLLPAASLVAMGINRRFQRLGDLLTDTMVVVEEPQWLTGVAKLEDARTAALANLIPSDFIVTRSLAKTAAAYVERRRFFTPLRRREIARHLADPLLRQFGMPLDTSHDLLMCAIYYRAFIADVGDETITTSNLLNGPPLTTKLSPP